MSTGSEFGRDVSPVPVAVAIVGAGLISVVVPHLILTGLDCSDDAALAASYGTRFFARVAFANAPALVAFVGSVLTGEVWLYAPGLAFAAIGHVQLVPTRGNLRRDQEGLNRARCGRSLVSALQGGSTAR